MSGNVSLSSISEDVRNLLEGEGCRLEAVEIVIGTRTFLVITCRVDYGHRSAFETPTGLIKFSKTLHAIPESPNVQLGSSRYYREHEDDNIADAEEGRLVQRGAFSEFCKTTGVPSQPGAENVSLTVTWARPDFLMFCTSEFRQGRSFEELQSQFPDYDCATLIPDPSAFAMQLGRDVGAKYDVKDVQLSNFDRIKQMMPSCAEITMDDRLLQRGLVDAVVWVSHGPVTYGDPPEEIVRRFPTARRARVVPFVKRGKFAGQHEYRFVVEVMGEPKVKTFLMEVSDELRRLTRPHSSG